MESSVFPFIFFFWAAFTVASSIFIVKENTVAIIERLGSFHQLRNAGLHFKIPIIDRIAGKVSLDVQQKVIPLQAVANDNTLFKIRVLIEFRVSSDRVQELFYQVPNPDKIIKTYIEEAVSADLRRYSPEEAPDQKNDMSSHVHRAVEKDMYEHGFSLLKTQVTDVRPA